MASPKLSPQMIQQLLRHRNPWVKAGGVALLLLVILLGSQVVQEDQPPAEAGNTSPSKVTSPTPAPAQISSPIPEAPGSTLQSRPVANSPATAVRNGYEKLTGVTLVEHRNNDGDSFFVRHGDREFELRLYFVDTPEKYLSDRHQDQRDRVADQARDLGLTVDLTVTLGNAAKKVVHDLLESRSFTVYTNWEAVYDSDRFHGFVELADPDRPGQSVYLTEILIRKGLGRIHTKGEATPDGRSWQRYRDHLESVQKDAQRRKAGAWAL